MLSEDNPDNAEQRQEQSIVTSGPGNLILAMQSAVLAIVNPSVRPSVRLSVGPSHAGTVSKQRKLPSWGFHWKIAP